MALTLPPDSRTPLSWPVRPGNGLRASHGIARTLRVLLALALALWLVLPLVPLALWAFADRWSFPAVLPQAWGWGGVRAALAQGAVPAFGRSLLLGLLVSAVATPLGVLAARALAYRRVPLAPAVNVLLFAPLALPAFVAALGLNVLLLRVQVPPFAGVVLLLTVYALPYTSYTMRVAYGAHDLAVEEEARLLGASAWQVMWRVQLPLLAPALARAAFLAFLVGWSDYVITVLVGGGTIVTVPLLVAAAAAGTGNDATVALLSAAALLPPLVLLLVLGLFGRRPRSHQTNGDVK
ncbi:ABC transporter permease subunit [Paenarthrobacter sp. PH39-S1]|uniref:ABC transporter permease n=1 Tax=Paenarthrobacter sp. PH39-S1 TaxID=3046204 RepID=UPI0024BBE11F|nr:ABC transporter permease subunit [Paenarthrobacter sp. PH39-S1]MDJ0358281.1 ABC transporter permease subunit [Paenarthrobacter sp. PH39-S1]